MRFETNGQTISYDAQGNGPPVLLLHGFPQTRAMWRPIAAALAKRFTVVTADLRGYGESPCTGGVSEMTFRKMAGDQTALMAHLGFERFHLVGHDRGARTAHRLALDAPSAVASLTVMDIVPTETILSELRTDVAQAYYHWFFLAQPSPLPERMIGADADSYYESCLAGWGGDGLNSFEPEALAEYRHHWRKPEVIAAMCDDYRAAIAHDWEMDKADLGKQVDAPSLVLWGADGLMARAYDVAATWAPRLSQMQARALPGGHFFPDTHPAQTIETLSAFLDAQPEM